MSLTFKPAVTCEIVWVSCALSVASPYSTDQSIASSASPNASNSVLTDLRTSNSEPSPKSELMPPLSRGLSAFSKNRSIILNGQSSLAFCSTFCATQRMLDLLDMKPWWYFLLLPASKLRSVSITARMTLKPARSIGLSILEGVNTLERIRRRALSTKQDLDLPSRNNVSAFHMQSTSIDA